MQHITLKRFMQLHLLSTRRREQRLWCPVLRLQQSRVT